MAALTLPQLTENSSDVVPTWMKNATVLGTHFSNGIDLFSPSVWSSMDVGDLNSLFPTTVNTVLAKDVSLCFAKLLQFNRSNNPMNLITEESLLLAYLRTWEAWSSNEDFFQVLAIIPAIEGILTRAHISFTMDTLTLYVDPICAQAIWNTGILDEYISKDSNELPENPWWSWSHIATTDQICRSTIRINHKSLTQSFHTQVKENSCRPWLWGHTTQ